MDNQHQKISGYRNLTQAEIDCINAIKAAETALGELWRTVTAIEGVDHRWTAIARTHFEEGCSSLVRSIARPESQF